MSILDRLIGDFDHLRGHTHLDSASTGELSTDSESPARVTDDGAWTWFNDPRAVHYNGVTYFGWVTSDGDIEIAALDYANGTLTRTILHPDFEADDHDNPTVLVRDDGHILAFYSAHNGDEIYLETSDAPEDVASFTRSTLPTDTNGNSYTNPVQLDSGRIFLFYRNADRNMTYQYSDDGGASWSGEQALISGGGQGVYHKVSTDGTRIDFGLTDALEGDDGTKQDVRHAYLDGSETLHASDGTEIASSGSFPVSFSDTTVVYDSAASGNTDVWIWDCATHEGNVELTFAEFPDNETHLYRFARWDGASWSHHSVADGGSYLPAGYGAERYYSGGIVLDHSDPGTVYLSVAGRDSGQIFRYETDDGGITWDATPISGQQQQNIRPVVPRNAPAEMPVVWLRGDYNQFQQGGYRMAVVTGAERMTGPASPVRTGGFSIAPGPTLDTPSGSYTHLSNLDGIGHDIREEYDGAGRFVASRAGLYLIEVRAEWEAISAAGLFGGRIVTSRNNREIERSRFDAGDEALVSDTVVMWLYEGTAVEPKVWHNTGATETVKGDYESVRFTVTQLGT